MVKLWLCISLCSLIHLASQHFLTLTSAALYLPFFIHMHLFDLVRILMNYLTASHTDSSSSPYVTEKLFATLNVERTWWFCAPQLDSVCVRGTSLLWYCDLSQCVCVSVYHSESKPAQDHCRLLSGKWVRFGAGALGILLPRHPSVLILSITVACWENAEFVSIIWIPGSVVSCVCASRWCLWLMGSACWFLKL